MTIFGITFSEAVMWLMIAGIMAILEAITMGLTCIWFVGGAVCAAIAAAVGAPVIVQVIIFLVVSAILVACTRPLAKKKLNDRHSRGRPPFLWKRAGARRRQGVDGSLGGKADR